MWWKSRKAKVTITPTQTDNVFVVGNPVLVETQHEFALQRQRQHQEYGGNYRCDKYCGDYHEAGRELLQVQQEQARQVASHLTAKNILPHKVMTIPIVYAPDGGLNVAWGFGQGMSRRSKTKYEIFPLDWGSTIPESALELARETGYIVFCEDVVGSGITCVSFLKHIPKEIKGPNEKNIEVLIYSNLAVTIGEVNCQPEVFQPGLRFLQGNKIIQEACPSNCNLRLFISDYNISHDVVDIGDVLAHSGENLLRGNLIKRSRTGEPPPDWRKEIQGLIDDVVRCQIVQAPDAQFNLQLGIPLIEPKKKDTETRGK